MSRLVELATENAKLKALQESQQKLMEQREQFLGQIVETRQHQAELEARLAVAEEKEELLESVVELVAENAKLSAVAEFAEEHIELIVKLAQFEGKSESQEDRIGHRYRVELEKRQSENDALKRRVAELEQRLAEIIATRPSSYADTPPTAPRR